MNKNSDKKLIKADLHLHSKFSEHPSEWFLQRLGAQESYVEPDYIYQIAKEQGMSFVTITDHNRIEGALYLTDKYPEDTFTGVEVTTYFPEDNCKTHVLVYGLTEKQFEEIQNIRQDIYEFRDYLKEAQLAHSVAHATYSINGKLTIEHLEKLILLFDVFEGINGGRDRVHNRTLRKVLSNLAPVHIEELYSKYCIKPFSDTPWVKNFTGGSDDHAGLFIGQTYTTSMANDIPEFLKNIRNKESHCGGRNNNYRDLAFMVYKVAYDFSRQKDNDETSKPFLSQLIKLIIEKQDLEIKNKIKLKLFKGKKSDDTIYNMLFDLVDDIKDNNEETLGKKLNLVYNTLAKISDEFLKGMINSIKDDLIKGDILHMIKNISVSIPGVFLSIPFFSSMKHMHSNRDLLRNFSTKYGVNKPQSEKEILWFTDSLNDLNGVSVSLKKMGWESHQRKIKLKIATCMNPHAIDHTIPPNVLYLPYISSFKLPSYEKYVLKVPSLLNSLEQIYLQDPDEIYISTPGPVGLTGLLAAKLLDVKCVGIYHTDFPKEAKEMIEDEAMINFLQNSIRWFYSQMDKIGIYTPNYVKILKERNFDSTKFIPFYKAINSLEFRPIKNAKALIKEKYGLQEGTDLLYVGRVSKDKGLDFLIDIYYQLTKTRENLNLLIIGDGPHLDELKERTKNSDRIVYIGEVDHDKLPEIYSAADVFVFPSITDTFGLVVLEAQACGLPAIVSNEGGPQTIIDDTVTGYVVNSYKKTDWLKQLENLFDMIESNPNLYKEMRVKARKNVIQKYNWDNFFAKLYDGDTAPTTPGKKEHKLIVNA